jgi:hypothetical protein
MFTRQFAPNIHLSLVAKISSSLWSQGHVLFVFFVIPLDQTRSAGYETHLMQITGQ